jgi:hypothetical protein
MNTRSIVQLCFATAMLVPATAGAVVIERIGDSGSQAGAASEISLAGTDTHHLMTSLRDGNGNLLVIRWDVDLDGTVTRRGSTTGNEIVTATAIDAGFLPGTATPYWANVVKTGGQMKLILWGLSSNGPVRLDQDTGGTIKSCDVAVAGSNSFGFSATPLTFLVTLCQYTSNAVDIRAWAVHANGTLEFTGSLSLDPGFDGGAIPKLAYLDADFNDSTPVFLAGYRNADGNLRAATYRVNAFGNLSEVDVHPHAEDAIQGLAVGGDGFGSGVTAVRTSSGALKTIFWTNQTNNHIVRGQSASNGSGTGIAAGFLYNGFFATAGRDVNNNLDVDVWLEGQHTNDANAGAIQPGPVAMSTLFTGVEGRVFTAVADGAGNLKLIAWRVGEPAFP